MTLLICKLDNDMNTYFVSNFFFMFFTIIALYYPDYPHYTGAIKDYIFIFLDVSETLRL